VFPLECVTNEGLDEICLIAVAELIDNKRFLVLGNLLVRLEVLDLNETIEQLLYVLLCDRFRCDLELSHQFSPFVPAASAKTFLMSTVDFLKKTSDE